MATTVYTVEEVTLQDGTSVTLRPVNIKGLRKFMAKMAEFGNVESEDEGLGILLDAAAICLMREKPEYWDADKDNGKDKEDKDKTKGGATELFEEVADMPTVYKILDVCGGVKLNDPNLLRAAAESLGTT